MGFLEESIRLNDNMSNVLYNIIGTISSTISAVDRMNDALASGADMSAFAEMSENIANVREQIRGLTETALPEFEWQSYTGIEVFNTSGVERYRQEIDSLNGMMSQLAARQEQITQNAVYGNVLPPRAAADAIALNDRIGAIQQRIQQINANRANALDPSASAEVENLRGQLNDLLQIQTLLNEAMDNMDVERINQAFLQLMQILSGTERYIRDNVDEQGRFNSVVEQGTASTNNLLDTIKKIGGAYIGVKGIEKIVDMSDNLVTATARLDMMSSGHGEALYEQVFQAAQRARGTLDGMTDVVARFGNNAGEAFHNNTNEVIAFSELVQKQMTIAGASTQESANAMLQLSQALGSGVLRGDELNSIFEQAPNLIQGIADYLHVPIGQIREMASNGEITANIVKNSVFAAADEINARFNAMPMTWGQMWQSMKNQALMASNPVLTRMNEMFNDDRFQTGISAIMDGFVVFANFALEALNAIASAAAWVADNWEVIGPIVMTAATAVIAYKSAVFLAKGKQELFNAALSHSGLFVFIAGLGAFVAIMANVNNAINDAYDLSWSFGGFMGGSLMVIFAALGNAVLGVAKTFTGMWEAAKAVVQDIGTWFYNLGVQIEGFFAGLFDSTAQIGPELQAHLEEEYGIKITPEEVPDLTSSHLKEYTSVSDAWNKGFNSFSDFMNLEDAFYLGQELGEKFGNLFNSGNAPGSKPYDYGEFDYQSMLDNIDDITDNTEDIKNGLEITDEELRYLRDIAEQEAINRFTTAEIKIEQTNNNNVSSAMDLDGIVSGLTDMAAEAVEIISEGVHA